MCVYRKIHFSLNLLIPIFHSLTVAENQNINEDLKMHKNWKLLPSGNDCGESLSDRIIGGTEALPGKYPWLAHLKLTNGTIEVYDCAGSIISSRYVITAAHCCPTRYSEFNLTSVRLGDHQLSKDKDCQNETCSLPVQDFDVESYVFHQKYNRLNYHNDICIIRTQKTIIFNRYVHPVCLPTFEFFTTHNFEDIKMEVVGWGVKNITTGEISDVLEVVWLPIVPLEVCQDSYFDIELSEKQICAGGVIGKDSCKGDSGGPVMKSFSIDGPPRYFIIGIVSFGPENCGEGKTPGVNTRVDKYVMWILNNMRE